MVERRLAAILAADVVGYSKLIGADQDATLAALRSLRSDLFTPAVTRNGGETVKSLGDGWIVAFASVTDAVQCAIDVQEGLPAVADLELRMGVHLGDIVREEEDLFGDGVNIAARLQAAAAPGDILISDVVHHSLDGRLSNAFHKKPPLNLKNIERPIPVFSWRDTTEGTQGDQAETATHQGRRNIGVSFAGLEIKAGDDDATLLCEGVSEAIRAGLITLSGLSLFTDPDKADMVIEGSLTAVGVRYRAIVRLIDQHNQKLIKSEKFDGVIADLFEAEDELALRICTSLRFAAFGYEASTLQQSDRPLIEQENSVIRVRAGSLLSDLKFEDWLEARYLLDIVLERDPDDASALAMAGMARTVEVNCGWRKPDPEDCEEAINCLRKATRLNPKSDFAQTILSLALLELKGDFSGALFTAEQLMTTAPHYAQGQMAHAAALISNGQKEEGAALALKAIEPLKSLRLFSQNAAYLMLGLLLSRRHDEVLVWGQMVNQRIENVPRNLLLMISAATHLRDATLARDYAQQLMAIAPDFTLGAMRHWPLKGDGDWAHLLEGLQDAGLPD